MADETRGPESVFRLAVLPLLVCELRLSDSVKYEFLLEDKSRGSVREPCHDTALDLQILMCMCIFRVSV